MQELLLIAIGSALVNNVVLSQFLGLCPFLGVSKKVETSAGMGAAVIFVITLACIAITNVQKEYNFIESVVNGIGISVGFTIAIVMLAGIREKLENNDIPYNFQGSPIVLITAGLMAIAFFGFSGLI